MRIGMMADIYKPHVSGVTNVIELTQSVLQARGHEVSIFTFGEPSPGDQAENIIRSSGIPIPIREPTVQLNFRYSDQAKRALQSMDIVHVHHPFLSGRLALRYAKAEQIPIVFTNHTRYDLYAQAYLPMMPDQIGTIFLHHYLPAFCDEVDMVIAPSKGLKQVLRELEVRSDITVVPNGVHLEPFIKVEKPIARDDLGFKPDDILLIYSGRLGPEKNLIFLLRAFSGVHQAYPRVKLVLVGKGPEMENLRDFVDRSDLGRSVTFVGFVPYEEVPGYLTMADIFVTASVTEVHPLSVIEAMAAGLPVVGIRSPGVGDIVIHEQNGLLASHDLASYASIISRMVADEQTRHEYGRGAADAAREYDVERTTTLLEKAYQELIAEQQDARRSFVRDLWGRLSRAR